jgi:hypothetical protein
LYVQSTKVVIPFDILVLLWSIVSFCDVNILSNYSQCYLFFIQIRYDRDPLPVRDALGNRLRRRYDALIHVSSRIVQVSSSLSRDKTANFPRHGERERMREMGSSALIALERTRCALL